MAVHSIPAIDQSAWTAYTPTITTGTGAITTLGAVSGRYKQIGKTVFISLSIAITTNGTGATNVQATLPVAAGGASFQVIAGEDVGITGKALKGRISTGCLITFYDNTYPGANGCLLVLTGSYETT